MLTTTGTPADGGPSRSRTASRIWQSPPFESIGLIVDLKLPGYEQRVLDALNEHGLLERSIVSSQFKESLELIRGTGSRVRLGWSVPRARRDYTRSPFLAGPGVRGAPADEDRASAEGRQLRFAPVSAMRSSRTGGSCRRGWSRQSSEPGGELYAWTVDDAARIRELEALGVTGVITNDPRLFDPRQSD